MQAAGYEADPLQYSIVSQPQYGTATIYAGGNVVYQPTGAFHDHDSFTFKVTDPVTGLSSDTLWPVNIQFVNP